MQIKQRSSSVVDFICLGAPRAGTTWLYNVLSGHPDIFIPEKELHFFIPAAGRDYYEELGVEWFSEQYSKAPKHAIKGDIAAGYLRSELALERIAKTAPEAKFIIMIRNPIDRVWSDYLYCKGNKVFSGSFCEFIENSRSGARALNDGLYGNQISNWFDCFSRSRFFLVFLDDVNDSPKKTYTRVCDFLGVDAQNDIAALQDRVNPPTHTKSVTVRRMYAKVAAYAQKYNMYRLRSWSRATGLPRLIKRLNESPMEKEVISEADKRWLCEYYSNDIQLLEKLASRSLSHWYSVK